MNERTRFNRTGETAGTGAVAQKTGRRPVATCGDCGKRVVSIPSKSKPGKWNIVNVYAFKNDRGFYYIGAHLHKC